MDLSQSQSGFRSRRSYPSLNHVSLAPLTPRFPIDDDGDDVEPRDYFSPQDEAVDTPTRTSYLSSYSVPGTPGVLSHSRSGSRARHHAWSKSSTPTHLSDSNLQEQNVDQPLHHYPQANQNHGGKPKRPPMSDSRDSEWMLRAGIALASSAREEKGQSWLVKRESSTSLVSDANKYDVDPATGQTGRTSRRSRSGRSTPAAFSRRGSRSRAISRRGSRPDLAMTGLEMTTAKPVRSSTDDEVRSFVPDFVDERIRAEMRNIQRDEGDDLSVLSDEDWDSEEDEEIDEHELQRLTRERGFGLGSWVDRMVEWTLFSVDDWPISATGTLNQGPDGTAPTARPRSATPGHEDEQLPPILSDNEDEVMSDTNSEILTVTEKAGEQGGWADARWLLRVMKQAFM